MLQNGYVVLVLQLGFPGFVPTPLTWLLSGNFVHKKEINIGLQFLVSGLPKSIAFHEILFFLVLSQIGLAVSLVERGKVCAHW